MRHTWIRAAMAAPVLLVAAGCGGTSHRVLPVVSITERDFHISAPHQVPAGAVRLVLTNKGPVSHELLIIRAAHNRLPLNADGFTIDEDALHRRLVVYIARAGPGVRNFVVHLAPGRYIVLCNMAGHAASGMQTSFRVR
jgi:uncharacterized cupredoxin-like copper-binding protein